MRNVFALLALSLPVACAPAPAYPAGSPQSMVFDQGGTLVRLFTGPCDTKKVTLPEGTPPFFAAKVTWQGNDYVACWVRIPDASSVFIVDETGDAGPLQMSDFKPDDGV